MVKIVNRRLVAGHVSSYIIMETSSLPTSIPGRRKSFCIRHRASESNSTMMIGASLRWLRHVRRKEARHNQKPNCIHMLMKDWWAEVKITVRCNGKRRRYPVEGRPGCCLDHVVERTIATITPRATVLRICGCDRADNGRCWIAIDRELWRMQLSWRNGWAFQLDARV